MITKMKKLTFLVYHKEYEEFLNSLRELGVVHIVEKQQGAADNTELQENIRLSNRLTATLKLLQNQKHEKDAVIATEGGTAARGLQVLDEVDTLQTEHGKLSQQLQGYAKEREALQAWGNFDPASVRKLKDAGYVIGFYSCSEGNYQEEWETEYNAMIINRISSKVFFVTVTKAGQEVDLDVEQAKLPAYSLAHLETLYNTTEQAIEENEKKLVALSETDVPSLKVALKELQGQIEFSKVVLSSEQAAGDKLMLIEGWAPAYSKVEIEAYLNDAHVYYEITDPMPGDNVPIRLNNKGFFAWFEPICKLYMLPKYNELDLTPFFAPFFMIFFGLCLGDSGYGLFLFLGATAYRLLAKKVTPSMKSILSLIQVLAVSTFFCGLLTGTFFGANIYDLDWPIVQRLKHAVLMDNNDMFQLSLILGAVQILFGMVLKAAEHEADQAGYRVICGNSNNSINKDCAYINTFIDYCVDGILIIKSDSPKQEENEQLAELIRTLPSPVVAIDRQIDGLDVPTYTVNNMYGGYTATKHLLEMGHRRIGYYTYPLRVYTAAQRLKGYKMALAEYGVPYDPELVCQLSNGFSGNHRAVGDFRRKGVTAVFAHNDTLAYELYKFAQMEGVRVPSDMSIVGFDDLDFSTIITPGLTTIRQPVDEMTHGAFRRLVAMIEAGGKDPMRDSNSIYEPKLICRDSVCRL